MAPPPPGTFMWNELVTPDPATARDFYTTVFGWSTEEMPLPGPADGIYTIFRLEDRPVAGMLNIRSTHAPDGTPARARWFSYLCVEDVGAICRAITGAGGTVYRDPFVIPGVGTLAIVSGADEDGWRPYIEPGVGTLAIVSGADGSGFGIVQPEPEAPAG